MANLPEREVHEPVWDERTVQDRLRVFWDEDAKTYDRSPTHAATDPVEAAAWGGGGGRPPPPTECLRG